MYRQASLLAPHRTPHPSDTGDLLVEMGRVYLSLSQACKWTKGCSRHRTAYLHTYAGTYFQ